MTSTESQGIVRFLANLAHFQHQEIEQGIAAERITDGTLFLPHPDPEAQEYGFLIARWQGDPNRESEVRGTQIAEHEVIVAVRHWVTIGSMDNERDSIEHLFNHFKFKTGASLRFEKEDRTFSITLEKLLKDLGWTAFKKIVGL